MTKEPHLRPVLRSLQSSSSRDEASGNRCRFATRLRRLPVYGRLVHLPKAIGKPSCGGMRNGGLSKTVSLRHSRHFISHFFFQPPGSKPSIEVVLPRECARNVAECDYYLVLTPNANNDSYLDIHLEAKAKGWVAVGFSLDRLMVLTRR